MTALLVTLLAFTAPGAALAPLGAIEPAAVASPLTALLVPERHPPLAGTSTPRPAARAVDEEAFQAALDEAREREGAFGVTFALIHDGSVAWVGASGTTRDKRPMAVDEPMVIGSVTKTFVATIVLELVAEGRIGLDDSVRTHLPGLRSIDRDITVEQLLDHTSGLADVFNERTRVALETDPDRAWSPNQVLRAVAEPWYEPGEGWAYSNTNYLLLTLIAEEVTGQPLEELVAQRITGPLGLDATSVLTGAPGEALSPAWSTMFRGSGAMVSTAPDVARWGEALYAGTVLRPTQRLAMLDVNRDDYGLGVQRIEIAGVTGYGHTGLLNTNTTLLIHVPSRDLTIAMLVNRARVDLDLMLRAHPAPGEPSLIDLALALTR
ncbi:MAG TPA: serine hydrolase domain-containing protein [Candidatus Limnocylindria bacterium]|nr:serine hydrolase domain-containing protein [Candidatus Limnocylindria bacterium]